MKQTITYCVEYRKDDEHFYQPSFYGFEDKELSIKIAKKASSTLNVRIIEQRRRIVKVFAKR